MTFAAVRDVDVHYEIHGAGPRVVLLDGTGPTWARTLGATVTR